MVPVKRVLEFAMNAHCSIWKVTVVPAAMEVEPVADVAVAVPPPGQLAVLVIPASTLLSDAICCANFALSCKTANQVLAGLIWVAATTPAAGEKLVALPTLSRFMACDVAVAETAFALDEVSMFAVTPDTAVKRVKGGLGVELPPPPQALNVRQM